MALSPEQQPAEYRNKVDRSYLGSAGHTVGGSFDQRFVPRKTYYHYVKEASDTDAEEKNYCVKLEFEWQISVFTVQHIFKSEHGFTTPFLFRILT